MTDFETRFEESEKVVQMSQRPLRKNREHLARLDKAVKEGKITARDRDDLISIELLRKKNEKERAKKDALTDPLTSLPNRRAFQIDFAELVKSRRPFGLLIGDLDHFGVFNKELGHLAGDSALKQFGAIMKANVREEVDDQTNPDTISIMGKVGRYGGEECVALIKDVSSVDDLFEVAERIRKAVSNQPFKVKDQNGTEVERPVTISIGGGIYTPGENPKTFFRMVDKQALYKAKGEGEAEGEGRNRTVILPMRESAQRAA